MKSKKLLRFSIMDALELVLAENGISTPSRKTRKIIIKASEKISITVQNDLRRQQSDLDKEGMQNFPLYIESLRKALTSDKVLEKV